MEYPQLPFLTREMLEFGSKATLELETIVYSSSTETVTMVGMTREGVIKFDVTHGTGAGSEKVQTFKIPDFPITLNIFTNSPAIDQGMFFISVYLKIDGEKVGKLCSGYVSKQAGVSYPITHDKSEVGDQGRIRTIDITNPAAGAEIDQPIATNSRWRLIGMTAKLTADATVINRYVSLQIMPNTNNVENAIECQSALAHTANAHWKYSFAPYGQCITSVQNNNVSIPIPPNMPIVSGGRIKTKCQSLQVTDQWSAIHLFVEEFIED